MDVHDCGDIKMDSLELQPGVVLTIEPGIYLPEEDRYGAFAGIGVRGLYSSCCCSIWMKFDQRAHRCMLHVIGRGEPQVLRPGSQYPVLNASACTCAGADRGRCHLRHGGARSHLGRRADGHRRHREACRQRCAAAARAYVIKWATCRYGGTLERQPGRHSLLCTLRQQAGSIRLRCQQSFLQPTAASVM